jgi:hypothetical protein
METYDKEAVEKLQPEKARGEVGVLSMEGLDVGVKIADVRVRFGHIDYLVKPLNGKGEVWVERHRVKVMA